MLFNVFLILSFLTREVFKAAIFLVFRAYGSYQPSYRIFRQQEMSLAYSKSMYEVRHDLYYNTM